MPVTPADVVNQALARIGQKQRITGLTDGTPAATVANGCFDTVRDSVLVSAPWPFAKADATLLLRADLQRAGWSFVYGLPADYLSARYLFQQGCTYAPNPAIPFEIQADDAADKPVLCTDEPGAWLVYTRSVPALASLPPDFLDAFVYRLAAELALGVKSDPNLALALGQQFERRISAVRARLYNADKQAPRTSEFEAVRGDVAPIYPRIL